MVDTNIYSNQATDVRACFPEPSRYFLRTPPIEETTGKSLIVCLFWQGGGIAIFGGTVAITGTNIYSNQADNVRACFHEPSRYFRRTPPIEEMSRN